jgi:hydrophobic/amphiphilic exporter-1 (mainly G- bacteria), HAE1 family
MRPIVRWSLYNRPVVVLLSLIFVVGGVFGLGRINQELLPNIKLPVVVVVTADPGASPEAVDRDVSVPVTSALTGTAHLKHVSSQSTQGFSQVIAEFDLDAQERDIVDDVNRRIGVLQLPPGVNRPAVQTFANNALPTMTYSLQAPDGDLARATREAKERVIPAFKSASGVADVHLAGNQERAVTVTLDQAKLNAKGLGAAEVAQALESAQVNLPAGESRQQGKVLPVQVVSTSRTLDELKGLVIGQTMSASSVGTSGAAAGSGSPATPSLAQAPGAAPALVKLSDVATVAEGPGVANGISRTDGSPALMIEVIRAPNANSIAVSDQIKQKQQALKLSAGERLTLISDDADPIRQSLNALLEEGLLGALLAILIIFAFLRSLRATLVTAVSLPTSVLVALLGAYLWGFSLNVMTLAGLTIAIGRIVDDAIVVLENSYRHLGPGVDPRKAALEGATEVSSAVISSTLTTVAVFLPIGLVGGIISRLFLPFSVTVTLALLGSLVVSLTLIPVLVSFFLKPDQKQRRESWLARAYTPALSWSLARGWHKAVVLMASLLILAGSLAGLTRVPVNFLDQGGSNQLTGSVSLPAGTSTEETSKQLAKFEQAARRDPDVQMINTTMSVSEQDGFQSAYNTNEAGFVVKLKSEEHAEQARARLQQKLTELYGRDNAMVASAGSGPGSNSFTVTASGRELGALKQASDRFVEELKKDPSLSNVKSDLAAEKPQLTVRIDPAKAAAWGLSPKVIALALQQSLSTTDAGTLGDGGEPVKLRVDPSTITAEKLSNLQLAPGVLLKDVGSVSNQLAASQVSRKDGVRQVTVSAAIKGNDTNAVSAEATSRLQNVQLPEGVSLETGGTFSDINDTFAPMLLAIAAAAGIVFLILVAFFRSLITPFVILLTMPLALVGAALGLLVTHSALGLPALLGLLMVFGIVVSNAILLIDFVERARHTLPLKEALLLAGRTRLRPILMTALATVAALLPVATGISRDGGGGLLGSSLAVVVEGGLISSTALTLIVIPVIYSLLKRRATPATATAAEGERPQTAVQSPALIVRPVSPEPSA